MNVTHYLLTDKLRLKMEHWGVYNVSWDVTVFSHLHGTVNQMVLVTMTCEETVRSRVQVYEWHPKIQNFVCVFTGPEWGGEQYWDQATSEVERVVSEWERE